MTGFTRSAQREKLEQLFTIDTTIPQKTSFVRTVWTTVEVALEKIERWVTQDRSQPQIRSIGSQHGKTLWQVYDPMTRTSFYAETDTEVRTWLEQRYYS